MVRVRLLGGVGAATASGEPLDVGPAKCQVLLAALALAVGEPVPVVRLIDVIWGEAPPRTADKTLQGYVAQLRRGLGHDVVARVGAAYRLELDPEQVDVARFRRRLAAGDVDGALAVWTGTPLAGLDAPGLQPAIDSLVEQWLGAMETQLGHLVGEDAASTVATLTELTAAHPFREELWALLMSALYRTGRQADALGAFQRARAHLVDELGVEPGRRLREVESMILAHDEALHGETQASSPNRGQALAPVAPTGTVTFGFAEVADATSLWVEHRRKMAVALGRLDEVVREVTGRHGGTVVVAAGESIGAAFHRAEDAASWASELQTVVDDEPWPGGVALRLQIALHTGETREEGGGYFGPAVHIASRMAATAHPGQILVSGVTAALLERDGLQDLGRHQLDGVAGGHDLFQLDAGHHPPPRTSSSQLPGRSVRLFGRDEDLAALADALTSSPVVTLTGPGGVGKTSLALAAAHRAADDHRTQVRLVELSEITTSADVPHLVAETLGIGGGAGRTLTQSIAAALQARPTLLVLDNCEHVVTGAARLVQAITDAAVDLRVLTTSREPLGIPAEQVVSVHPLEAAGAAVALFADRARAAGGELDLADTRADVVELCRRLDGLPLAIELAAARTTSLSPAQLLARLDDRLRLLGGGRHATVARHQTLRATVRWSYDLLTPDEQRLFERLGVFAGAFDLAAAEAVATDADLDAVEVDRLVGGLVERSLVTVESGPFGRRFRLLETLREFAREALAERGEHEEVSTRHARWCRDQTADIGQLLAGNGEIEGVARLAELWADLRAAVEWACTTRAADLADALVHPIAAEVSLRRQVEIADWAERILDLTPPEDEPRIVYWLLWAGHRRAQADAPGEYAELVARHGYADHPVVRFNHTYMANVGADSLAVSLAAVDWLRAHGEEHSANLLEVSGSAASLIVLQRFDELADVAAEMVERHRRHAPPTLHYFALGMQAYAAQYRGRYDEAKRLFDKAERLDLPAGTYRVLQTAQARLTFEHGDRTGACRILRDNIQVLLDSDYTDVTRMVAVEFIPMMTSLGRLGDAARVLPYLDTTGDFASMARTHLIAEPIADIESDPTLATQLDADPDARAALAHMRDVLEDVIARERN
ncbi:BTAD domain-containing putative transcriptional regulator [Egicoccus sp. AB-alg2]|uniref:AfsR/SARP family transcriptional regulator n=1 Tax=Egicoccus sp. AB-alg2 TaxID=3242693 RepID=UPI00359CEA37